MQGMKRQMRRWHAGQRYRGEGGGGGGEGGVGGRGNGLQEVWEAAASIPGLLVCPVTNSCPYPSVPGSFSQREVLACSYKRVHLFNSMLVQFGSDDSIVCPICPKIESQTRIIGKLVILIKCPENCQYIILPLPSFSNIIDTTKNSSTPKIPLKSRFFKSENSIFCLFSYIFWPFWSIICPFWPIFNLI